MNELTLVLGYIKEFEELLIKMQQKYAKYGSSMYKTNKYVIRHYDEIVKKAYELERLKAVAVELFIENKMKLKQVA